jgi:hypothetical protein
VLEHSLDGNAGKVKHLDGVELPVEAAPPVNLNIYIADSRALGSEISQPVFSRGLP